MKKLVSVLMASALALAVLAGCGDSASTGSGSDTGSKTIKMSGSTSMEELAKGFSEAYGEKAGTTITVELGGSSVGFKNVQEGVSDIGNISRELKEEEKAEGLTETVVAIDGITVIVNPQNKVADLTSDQLKKIFTGEITNWKDVGGADGEIVVMGREAGSGTRGAFEELLGVEDACKYAEELNETGAVKTKVASTSGAIGYVSMSAVDSTVTGIKVDGVEPTEENAKSGSYALKRPFLMVSKPDASQATKDFLEWAVSDEGQEIVTQLKLISVK